MFIHFLFGPSGDIKRSKLIGRVIFIVCYIYNVVGSAGENVQKEEELFKRTSSTLQTQAGQLRVLTTDPDAQLLVHSPHALQLFSDVPLPCPCLKSAFVGGITWIYLTCSCSSS